MSKAVLDLDTPEPAETPEKGVNVDDLLAQMAGEEIDRLLSEADNPREAARRQAIAATPQPAPPPPPEPTRAPVAVATPAGFDPMDSQLDALFAELEGPPKAATVDESKPVLQPVAALPTEQLPAVENHTVAPPAKLEAKSVPIPAEAHAEVSAEGVASAVEHATHPAEEHETSPAERSALDHPTSATSDAPEHHEFESVEPERAIPFYLKPLVWLSAPLDSCSDETRSLIGKLALATLLNAVAVWAYVLVSHRRR